MAKYITRRNIGIAIAVALFVARVMFGVDIDVPVIPDTGITPVE